MISTQDAPCFCFQMLIVEPEKRYTLDDVIAHPWFRVGWDEEKFQAMKNGTIVNPSEKETEGAIKAAEESDAPGNKPGVRC